MRDRSRGRITRLSVFGHHYWPPGDNTIVVVGDHYGVEAGELSARVLKWIIVSMIQLPCEMPTLFKGRLGQASHQAVAELKAEGVLPAQTLVRTNKNLNNLIEQDHRVPS